MHISSFLLSAGLCATASLPRRDDSACTNPRQRLEWRALSDDVKKQYTDSVLCLKTKPSQLGLDTSRYDDFPYIHTHLDRSIHSVAMFLPWHRLFVHVYESSLRDCGYTGPMPYWDWTLDASNPTKAAVWDPDTGFGGNGDPAVDPWTQSSSKKCLVDGPFKDFQVAYTMGGYEPHCLARNFNNGTAYPGNMFAINYASVTVDNIMAVDNYPDFRYQLEGVPHGAIHSSIGGDMMPATSPNDPIFFLHHGQIDRLWALWQQQDLAVRETAFGGPKTQGNGPMSAALEDIMPFLDLTPDIKVEEVMSTHSSLLCYEYA